MTHPDPAPAPRPVPLALLRLVVTVHALAVFAQPVLAGQFLSGNFDLVEVHGAVGHVVWLFGLLQLPFAVLLRWPGRGPLWPLWVNVLVFLAESAQIGFGHARLLDLHIPFGVAITSVMLVLLVGVWRPRLGRPATTPSVREQEAGSHVDVSA